MSGIKITYHGRDFTKISVDLPSDDSPDKIKLSEKRILKKEENLNLLIKFLDSNKDAIGSSIVDTKLKKQLSSEKRSIYSIYNNEYYWSGLVGVIKGEN